MEAAIIVALIIRILFGGAVMGLGAKAFSEKGLPLSRTKNLTGIGARIIGTILVVFGLVWIVTGVWAAFRASGIL
jgi:hypothetical protein